MKRLFTVLALVWLPVWLSVWGLVFGLGASGCTKKDPAESRVPLAVKVEIAPIADHPWVVAFLTETTIAQPPGIHARLEGRTAAGRYFPEPMFEADTREALADLLSTYETTHARPPELVPIWEHEPFGPGFDPTWRLHFIDRSAGFVLDSEASAYLKPDDTVGPRVVIHFSPAQREVFATMTKDYLYRRMAFLIDGEVAMIPVVRTPIANGEVMLVGDPSKNPEIAAPALLKRLAGG